MSDMEMLDTMSRSYSRNDLDSQSGESEIEEDFESVQQTTRN